MEPREIESQPMKMETPKAGNENNTDGAFDKELLEKEVSNDKNLAEESPSKTTNESHNLVEEAVNQEPVAAVPSPERQPVSPAEAVEEDVQLDTTPTTTTTTTATPTNEDATLVLAAQSAQHSILQTLTRQHDTQRVHYDAQLEQLRTALAQKENMITLYQRENAILEKEKQAFRKEKDAANKEKESTVIKFAMKEKLLLDAKKEKEAVDRQLADARKEVKNVSQRFQAVNEEKSRMSYTMDEKCNEVRKYQRECEKWKTDFGHMESKLKYHINKLNMEVEARQALEKKLEEERNAPNKLEEKANEKLKVEFEANTILLKHELAQKSDQLEALGKDLAKTNDSLKQLQEQLAMEIMQRTLLASELEQLQAEHNSVQSAYSEEMLNSAKLRGQLDELQLLRTQNQLNEEKMLELNERLAEQEEKLLDNAGDLQHLHAKEVELLSINREMSESIVGLQNELCLLKATTQGLQAEGELVRREKASYDEKYAALEEQLKRELAQKAEERLLLAKHLSEKTKSFEVTKQKLEDIHGDYEAMKNKHATVVKELQRELQKSRRALEQQQQQMHTCASCRTMNGRGSAAADGQTSESVMMSLENGGTSTTTALPRSLSRNSSHSGGGGGGGPGSRRASESSESETVASTGTAVHNDLQGPSKKHLVERILRLQQASARQAEKIDFLENHTMSLVSELQKKSKVVQYYMLRDQAGALTSSKSDQNKSELAKYGNGVMSAIYNGIKGDKPASMTLELSLEINKKLQAVLEDTLLKNITLKENLDVLGLEVDNLTRKIRKLEVKE